jgi:hypothetical protein
VKRRAAHEGSTGSDMNDRFGSRSPETHVIVLIILIRVGKSGLFIGVIAIGVVIVLFIVLIILVELNIKFVVFILIFIPFLIILVVVNVGILLILKLVFFLLRLFLCLRSQTSNVVLLGQSVIDCQFSCNSIAITSDPIVLSGDTTSKLVEL